MSDKHIKLTRRRAIGGLLTIGGAAAAAGAGTFALFSDTESSTGNTLTAGTLDLTKDTTLSFTGNDIKPTESGSTSADLTKSGSVTGDLSISITDMTSSEGTPSGVGNSSGDGELDDQLELKFWFNDGTTDYGLDQNGNVTSGSDGTYATATNYSGVTWTDVKTNFDSGTFHVGWNFPDLPNNNDAQGDGITVDFEFTLEQQTP